MTQADWRVKSDAGSPLLKRWRWRPCCCKTASVSIWDSVEIELNSPRALTLGLHAIGILHVLKITRELT